VTVVSEPRVLAVADSDSYLKWARGTAGCLPTSWASQVVVLRSPIAPSATQMRATSSSGDVAPLVGVRRLRSLVRAYRPDVVLVACTGPVADLIMGGMLRGVTPRPAFAAGLPGIALHATEAAWRYRAGADLLVVHSHNEVAVVRELCDHLGTTPRVALTTLPFLTSGPVAGPSRRRVIFAPQALVPARASERADVLRALADLAHRRPELRVVVKVRGLPGEEQTHREELGYEPLWQELAARGDVDPAAIDFETGPIADHLGDAAGLVTVSSTAALEAVAAGVPILVLGDFGVGPEMLNGVFEESGCIGTLADLRRGDFRTPAAGWRTLNYFHPRGDDDLVPALEDLAVRARRGVLERQGRSASRWSSRARARARLAVPHRAVPFTRRAAGRLRRRS
jgi:hypothetical protein